MGVVSKPVKAFLREFSAAELEGRGVLQSHRKHRYLLKGTSVEPLLALMAERGVDCLVSGSNWELHADGRGVNKWTSQRALRPVSEMSSPGELFKSANERINPHYVADAALASTTAPHSAAPTTPPAPYRVPEPVPVASAPTRAPPSGGPTIGGAIFTSEDISKPENRCNLAIFHLLAHEPFHTWFCARLGLDTFAVLYPRANEDGVRPDFVAHDPHGGVLGAVEIELGGENRPQLASYRARYPRVFSITGRRGEGHLSLWDIHDYFRERLPSLAFHQLELSARYLLQLIETATTSSGSTTRQPVSAATLAHPFIATLLDLLADIGPLNGTTRPTPGRVYWDTVAESGFSLKVFTPKGHARHLALLSRSGGRSTIRFQSREKYLDYLSHKPVQALAWCDFIEQTVRAPISGLGKDSPVEMPMDDVAPFLPRLVEQVRALA